MRCILKFDRRLQLFDGLCYFTVLVENVLLVDGDFSEFIENCEGVHFRQKFLINPIIISSNIYFILFMIFGNIKASLIPTVSFLLGVGSIIICYYLSQIYHHEQPFPNTYISATAKHYPEFIVFRVGTISGAVLMILSELIHYYWIKTLCYEKVFNIAKYRPGIGTVMGVAGCIFLMGSTANLDTGYQHPKWHIFCAVNAFGWQIFSIWYHTFISIVVYANTKASSLTITVMKFLLSLGIVLQMLIAKEYGSMLSTELRNTVDHILEYTLAFSVFTFFLLLAFDVRGFNLTYKSKKITQSS